MGERGDLNHVFSQSSKVTTYVETSEKGSRSQARTESPHANLAAAVDG